MHIKQFAVAVAYAHLVVGEAYGRSIIDQQDLMCIGLCMTVSFHFAESPLAESHFAESHLIFILPIPVSPTIMTLTVTHA